ncbi:MAG: metallophosphoesterase [Chloroflexi bacterium]|nr:metallophosphoesterase [Chloroflexota bacterium]
MNLLAVSDAESPLIYSANIKKRFHDIDVAISCGDLSYFYLEYIISTLDIPLYYVRGNHAKEMEYGCGGGVRTAPWGGINLHGKVIRDKDSGLILSGIQGCIRYNQGDYQYSQQEMWLQVIKLVPSFLLNKIRFGRFLDIFVTHASPWGIHDQTDRAHHGVKAFLWLIKVFQPRFHLHGHIHIYSPTTVRETQLGDTMIHNVYCYRELSFDFPSKSST